MFSFLVYKGAGNKENFRGVSMSDARYAIRFDEATGRAHVDISGEIAPRKILNTFAAIALNNSWAAGDRSVLWQAQEALLPDAFEFADIFRATPLSQTITKPGKSAIVVNKSEEMVAKVARFYQSIAVTSTNRNLEVFYDEEEAVAWLNQ